MIKRSVSLVMVFVFLVFSLLTGMVGCATSTQKAALVGGTVGAIAGSLLDSHNRWRGGAIGAGLGALLAGSITEMSTRASREAAATNKTVSYTDENGNTVVASPAGINQQTKCKKVVKRMYSGGQIISETMDEICEGEKITNTY